MCLLVVASRVIPGTPLLIGANRDEFTDRPSTSFTVLAPSGPRILGGRDERVGGTWLAVNEHGVFAGLTNQPLPDGKDLSRRSRGELPLALAAHADADGAAEDFVGRFKPSDYNGCWLLVGDRNSLYSIDFTGSVDVDAVPLGPGVHVLENRPLGALSSKADRVVHALAPLDQDADVVVTALEGVLRDHHICETIETEQGPRPISCCVHLEGYGTRSSCLVRHDAGAAEPPRMWVADGPPCTTAFVEVSECWEQPR
ncbi:MAG TPA: NRDE family protein [Acidimicrobiales bacterium]